MIIVAQNLLRFTDAFKPLIYSIIMNFKILNSNEKKIKFVNYMIFQTSEIFYLKMHDEGHYHRQFYGVRANPLSPSRK